MKAVAQQVRGRFVPGEQHYQHDGRGLSRLQRVIVTVHVAGLNECADEIVAWIFRPCFNHSGCILPERREFARRGHLFVFACPPEEDDAAIVRPLFDALEPREATTIMLIMLFAGHETTTNLLGNSFHRLLADRASWEAICREPGLIPNAIEEVLRFDSSVITWRHKAKQAVDIGGVSVPAEAKLLLLLGSANRDPAVFANPDEFDIRRPNAREHLSFGYGVHNCLGAPLARLEARVVLEEVSRRLPTLRLAGNTAVEFPPSISMRGPCSLKVEW